MERKATRKCLTLLGLEPPPDSPMSFLSQRFFGTLLLSGYRGYDLLVYHLKRFYGTAS